MGHAHTKDKLARALRAIDLEAMAVKAEEGYYHDYLSPLAMPSVQLVNDLLEAASDPEQPRVAEILVLRDRVINGDFDASEKESDDRAKSAEGQEAFSRLVRDRKP
jgi:hypothetical protein